MVTRGLWVILKKEVKTILSIPQFWLVAALMLTVLSWVFPSGLKMFELQVRSSFLSGAMGGQVSNIHYGLFLRHLSYVNLILIFITPAITMRLLAEERKLRTFDLLLTSPITSWDIVLGKFGAGLVGLLVLLGLSALYPVSMRAFAQFHWGLLILAYLAVLAVGGIYLAMGLFSSSVTESGIIAYVLGVIFNVFIWFVGVGVDVVDTQWIRSVFEYLSISQHLSQWVEGTLRTTALVYFGSILAFFLFLSERMVESYRWR